MRSLHRTWIRAFERLSARPLGILVMAASIALLVTLEASQIGRFRAQAVAHARLFEQPALVSSIVERVYVRVGDVVEQGAPLVDLSSHFVVRELAVVEAEIEQRQREAGLAQAELLIEEERWLDQDFRRRPSRPSLRVQTEAFHAARLERLRTRRDQLLEDRSQLAVVAGAGGRVAFVAERGSSVAVGTSIATLTPEHAEEVIAYVPPQTDPSLIAPGAPVRLLDSQVAACRGTGLVQRRGSRVEQAPSQLARLFQLPLYGLPVYVSIPEGCQLGVGQVLSVEFPKAGV
jgi:multidrug efflux pump subunit AcrA (membrane-fusion protein)